jgi:NAD(P)-dependent dehydrogenase (short-subunit alcohol dehydrogenase family)
MAYGPFDEIPSEVFRQIIETNLMGQIHGARSALRRFRDQGSGVLINMSSVWGRVSTPQVTPYIVSKNAVRAFSECLNGELADEKDIHVATMVPQAVDTPIFEHAGNYSGRRLRPIPRSWILRRSHAGSRPARSRPSARSTTARRGGSWRSSTRSPPSSTAGSPTAPSCAARWRRRRPPPSSGNVLSSTDPHAVEGGWRRRRRPALRRAFAAAALGALAGLGGGGASLPRK